MKPSLLPRHRDTPNAVLALLDAAAVQRDLSRRHFTPQELSLRAEVGLCLDRRASMRALALLAVALARRLTPPAKPCVRRPHEIRGSATTNACLGCP